MKDLVDGLKKTAQDILSKKEDKASEIQNVIYELRALKEEYLKLDNGLEGIVAAIRVYEPGFKLVSDSTCETDIPKKELDLQIENDDLEVSSRIDSSKPLWRYIEDILKKNGNKYTNAKNIENEIFDMKERPNMVINSASILSAISRKKGVFDIKREDGKVLFRLLV